MTWPLSFISESDFTDHVRTTIEKYGEKLEPYDLAKFNKNLIDPIKMIFDKSVYQTSWEQLINNEVFRQRDKSNNNDIGYFHQRIFRYFKNCHVPDNGTEGGWDVIYQNDNGIALPDGDIVKTIYVEMKNKHNTMNSSSAGKTYIKMQNQLLQNDDCACFLVEAIAKRSQNIKWVTTVNGANVSHKRIRRVSIDQFYSMVTGVSDAFFQICMVLPEVVKGVVTEGHGKLSPHDTVYEELREIASRAEERTDDISMAVAIYLLGFSTYQGFSNSSLCDSNLDDDEKRLNRICAYAKKLF